MNFSIKSFKDKEKLIPSNHADCTFDDRHSLVKENEFDSIENMKYKIKIKM